MNPPSDDRRRTSRIRGYALVLAAMVLIALSTLVRLAGDRSNDTFRVDAVLLALSVVLAVVSLVLLIRALVRGRSPRP